MRREVPDLSALPALLEAVADCSALPGLLEAGEAKKRCMALRFSSGVAVTSADLESKQLRMMMKMMMMLMLMLMLMLY